MSGRQLQWELDVWGRFRRGIEQATADAEQQVELYDDMLAIVVADTAKAYVSMRTAEEFLRLAVQNVNNQKGSLDLAGKRFKEGAVGELDVTQAESTLRETTALVPEFQRDLRQANLELCNLLGIPMRDLTSQVGQATIPVVPTSVAVEIPAELMRRRPDIRAAERRCQCQRRNWSRRQRLVSALFYRRLIQLDGQAGAGIIHRPGLRWYRGAVL